MVSKEKFMSKLISFFYFITSLLVLNIVFTSSSYAELSDSVENLKTCGSGKTYSEDSDSCFKYLFKINITSGNITCI